MVQQEQTLSKPAARIAPSGLPNGIRLQTSSLQAAGLAFGVREYMVVGAKVNTFNVGGTHGGTVILGGISRSLGPNWGAFGGLGTINQTTVNQFKTDVQLKLEDPQTGQKTFLETSLPFEITLSIDPGEKLAVYFARGGLAKPVTRGDFYLSDWTPFAAQDLDTGQIVPVAPLPSLLPTKVGGIGCGVALIAYGALAVCIGLLLMTNENTLPNGAGVIFVHTLLFILPGLVLAVFRPSSKRRAWENAFETAKSFASTSTV